MSDVFLFFKIITNTNAIIWLISWLIFIRCSIKSIEKRMAAEGELPASWDSNGWGFRFSMYAMVLVAGKPAKVSLINDALILKHATRFDRIMAFICTGSMIIMLITGALITWGPEAIRFKGAM
ncbi:hypothetical protein L4C36_06205 [Photobacterium japonica]|uniref:hypothetical protein n=1 Tax=Photobacterium japonica TaxID=2910235 RepID=UPI003D108AAF